MDSNKYIGLPFEEKGRGPSAYDCWGLLRLVFDQEFGIRLPSFTEDYVSVEDSKHISSLIAGNINDEWAEISFGDEETGDGILMTQGGIPRHVGVVVSPGFVLHTERKTGSIIEPYNSSKLRPRVMAFYRHISRTNDNSQTALRST